MTARWTDISRDLRGMMKPRFVTLEQIRKMAEIAKPGVSRNTVYRWVKDMEHGRILQHVHGGVYANLISIPPPSPAEAAHMIRPGAIVSLQTVLGEHGVANNPSAIITCVVPVDSKSDRELRRFGEVETGMGKFWFFPVSKKLYAKREEYEAEMFNGRRPFDFATPEKAIVDWLYVATKRPDWMTTPPLDFDMAEVNMNRLERLAAIAGVIDVLDGWLSDKALFDGDVNVQRNMNTALGF